MPKWKFYIKRFDGLPVTLEYNAKYPAQEAIRMIRRGVYMFDDNYLIPPANLKHISWTEVKY